MVVYLHIDTGRFLRFIEKYDTEAEAIAAANTTEYTNDITSYGVGEEYIGYADVYILNHKIEYDYTGMFTTNNNISFRALSYEGQIIYNMGNSVDDLGEISRIRNKFYIVDEIIYDPNTLYMTKNGKNGINKYLLRKSDVPIMELVHDMETFYRHQPPGRQYPFAAAKIQEYMFNVFAYDRRHLTDSTLIGIMRDNDKINRVEAFRDYMEEPCISFDFNRCFEHILRTMPMPIHETDTPIKCSRRMPCLAYYYGTVKQIKLRYPLTNVEERGWFTSVDMELYEKLGFTVNIEHGYCWPTARPAFDAYYKNLDSFRNELDNSHMSKMFGYLPAVIPYVLSKPKMKYGTTNHEIIDGENNITIIREDVDKNFTGLNRNEGLYKHAVIGSMVDIATFTKAYMRKILYSLIYDEHTPITDLVHILCDSFVIPAASLNNYPQIKAALVPGKRGCLKIQKRYNTLNLTNPWKLTEINPQ